MEFAGQALRLGAHAIETAATALGCDQATVRAVIDVESRGGFDEYGRPKILFERHYFHRLTGGRFSPAHPGVSAPRWGGYGAQSAQYDRLARAILLDRPAALRSASWGMFQIMGDNYEIAGFDSIEGFVDAMTQSEGRHLEAFVAFVRSRRLDDALVRRDWQAFARGYNGPAFAANRYDEKLARAYARHAGPVLLKRGDRGAGVRRVQERLAAIVDGIFGHRTEAAVIAFQRGVGLVPDGIVGPRTWAALPG